MARDSDIVVGLDIGTTKICAIVGEITDGDNIQIIGIGTHPSKGLRKGVVVHIDSTVESIQKAVQEAERMSGKEITSAFVGYSLALLQNSIWYKRNWAATLRSVFDGLVYAPLTAGTFGWLWPA